MTEASTSLWVAIGAAVLLVAVVSADAAINRTFTLEVEQPDGGWATIATSDGEPSRFREGAVTVEANRSEALTFRLRVDNEPPWSFEETYRVEASGIQVAQGTIQAPAGGQASVTFEATVEDLADGGPPSKNGSELRFAHLFVEVDGTSLFGSFHIQEVPAS